MKEYAVIIERGNSSYGAYVPDLPGCVAAAQTESEVRQLIREAIQLHVRAMVEDGEPVPEPTSKVEYVALALAS
jgi:predicted RNase H-like HicB family nuclease